MEQAEVRAIEIRDNVRWRKFMNRIAILGFLVVVVGGCLTACWVWSGDPETSESINSLLADLTITIIAPDDKEVYLSFLTDECKEEYLKLESQENSSKDYADALTMYEFTCRKMPSSYLEYRNTSASAVYDVDTAINFVGFNDSICGTEKHFEAKWEPNEKVLTERPTCRLEKVTVTITSRRDKTSKRFEFYSFPQINSGQEVEPEITNVLASETGHVF